MGGLFLLSVSLVFVALGSQLPASTACDIPNEGCGGGGWVAFGSKCFLFVTAAGGGTGYTAPKRCQGLGQGSELANLFHSNLAAFWEFMKDISKEGGTPYDYYLIRPVDGGGCRMLTWLQGGTPIAMPITCALAGPFICERSNPCPVPASVITPLHTGPTLDLPHSVPASVITPIHTYPTLDLPHSVPASVITPIHTDPTLDLPHSIAASVGPQFYSDLARPPYSAAYPSYSGPALHHPFIRPQLPHSA